MDLKIGAVAKMTGLSPSGIRFLEEQGLLSPSGGRKGSYRSYSLADVATLLDYRNYRKCGLSQETIVHLLTSEDGAAASAIFEQRCDELEAEILEAARLLRFLRRRSRDAVDLPAAGTGWEFTERPALVWLPLRSENGHADWPEDAGFDIPYTDSVLLFDAAGLAAGEDPALPSELGIGLLEVDSLGGSFLGQAGVRHFAPGPALHTVVEITDDFLLAGESLARCRADLRETLAENGLALRSDHPAVTRRILTMRRDGRPRRYDHLWVDLQPVKKITKRT
ncbi:MAG: MerR family transcriptional regulator [Eubacteriales bacterium]|nr:MerR family transcriptional regulator [Eubacteriales bacterium]